MFHIFGLNIVLTSLHDGKKIIFLKNPTPFGYVEAVEKHRVRPFFNSVN
jgi:hypothetical protein